MIWRQVAVRAYLLPLRWDWRAKDRKARTWVPPDQETIFVFDVETATKNYPGQPELVGSYLVRHIDWSDGTPRVTDVEEGMFFPDDLQAWRPDEYAVLVDYVRSRKPRVSPSALRPDAPIRANPDLRLITETEFIGKLADAISAQATIVAFNAPFDLSRLAKRWYRAQGKFLRGVGLPLKQHLDKRGQLKATMVVRTKRLAPKLFKIEIETTDPYRKRPQVYGRVLDLSVLTFALSDTHYTLKAACEEYGVSQGKGDQPELGRITIELLDYVRQDVTATAGLYVAALREYRTHPIQLDPIQAMSPATISKAYLRAIGIRPVLVRSHFIDPKVLGWAMSAYYGGRSECLIRKMPVPVTVLDIRSTYPMLAVLLGIYPALIAERIVERDDTASVQRFLDQVALEECLDKSMWKQLLCVVQIEPDGDVLPVRTRFADNPQWDSGFSEIHANTPLWWSLADVIASVLRTGHVPRIRRAIRFVPQGRTAGIKDVSLGGRVLVRAGDDLFKVCVEQRERIRRSNEPGAKRLQQFLKTLANAASYGLFVEYRRLDLVKGETQEELVYGRGDRSWTKDLEHPEEPGPWFFPPFGACVTGGARLILTMTELMVAEAGGTHAYMDTDSIFVVSTEHGEDMPEINARALSWSEVDDIISRLAPLNPLDREAAPGSIIKIEDENYTDASDPTSRIAPIFFGISSKRYCLLFEDDEVFYIIKGSDHGLSHMLVPADLDENEDNEVNRREASVKEIWRWLVRTDLGMPVKDPAWLDLPAVGKLPLSTADAVSAFDDYGAKKPWRDQIKPHGFALTCFIKPGGQPTNLEDPNRFHLVAPFERNFRRWRRLHWFDLYSEGKRYRIKTGSTSTAHGDVVVVRSYRDVLQEYLQHPEAKMSSGEKDPSQFRGRLDRQVLHVAGVTSLGKETNELERRLVGLVDDLDEVQVDLGDPESDLADLIRDVLRPTGAAEIARQLGVGRVAGGRFRRDGGWKLGNLGQCGDSTHLLDGVEILADAGLAGDTGQWLGAGLRGVVVLDRGPGRRGMR